MADSMKILIVDDNPDLVELIKDYLEMKGIFPELGYSGSQAIAKVQSFSPDLVLLDVEMPGMNGLQTLEWIKKNSPMTRVVMVTGHEDQEMIDNIRRLGADHYLVKPIDLKSLDKTIKDVLAIEK